MDACLKYIFFAYTPIPQTWNPESVPGVKYIHFWWLSSVVRGVKIQHDHEYDKKLASFGLRLNEFVSYLSWYD